MDDKRLAEIRERESKVPKLRWISTPRDGSGDNVFAVDGPHLRRIANTYGSLDLEEYAAIEDFIAHSREDVPWLLAEVERLKNERDLLARECGAWRKAWDGQDCTNEGYQDPFHSHAKPSTWDDTGLPCEMCQRYEIVEKARAATDAAGVKVEG